MDTNTIQKVTIYHTTSQIFSLHLMSKQNHSKVKIMHARKHTHKKKLCDNNNKIKKDSHKHKFNDN